MPLVIPTPPKPTKKRVGMLQLAPVVSPPDEHLRSAVKRAARVAPSAAIKNEAEKERNRAARQLDTLMKELSVPLTKYLSGFPKAAALHPFEAALLDLTVGRATYQAVLGKVDSLRKGVQEVGKAYANKAAKAANKKEATAAAEEGAEMMQKVFTKGMRSIDDLKRMSKQLRSLPYVEPSLPTMALVGAPNVGKSSLVQVLSSGTPEVCDYPFTTRSIKMGHFWVDARKHQVTDTPGLLARPDDQRNAMELLTLAALSYLPSSVVFVADLTEGCGTSCADQWAIRQELRQRFSSKVWVDVLSKADLLADVWLLADSADVTPGNSRPGGGHSVVAVSGGAGPERGAPQLNSGGEAGPGPSSAAATAGGGGAAADPVLAFARLPGALRVSSLTGAGVEALKARVMEKLQEAAAAEAATAGAAEAGVAGVGAGSGVAGT